MINEEWKTITGYEGLYEVSNLGNVRSLKRTSTKGKILKGIPDKDGYLKVCLSKHNVRKTKPIHRLVATEFIKKRNETDVVVNHKNENKQDNRAENLEWCDVKYNTNYNGSAYKRMECRRRRIVAIKGETKIEFIGVTVAAEFLGVSHSNISSCLTKKYGHKTIKGFSFEYL